jgi:hypothetical protein
MNKAVREFLNNIEKESKREDCKALLKIMEEESGYKAALNGSIIGFGQYHYKYESGREGDWFVTGFSPRAQNLSIYIMPGFEDYRQDLEKLGKHKTAKSCLYINKLADINEKVLRKIIRHSVKVMQKRYPCKQR